MGSVRQSGFNGWPTIVDDQTIAVDNGSLLCIRLSPADPANPVSAFSFANGLLSNAAQDGRFFQIDRTTGTITSAVPFDYSTTKYYALLIRSVDFSGRSDISIVSIQVRPP